MADAEKTTNSVVQTLKSLPEPMIFPVIIQNPCNTNEIFIIGAQGMNDIYIYNQATNTFKKNENDDLTSILSTYPQSKIKKCHALQCEDSNSIIVLGTIQLTSFQCISGMLPNCCSFYSIFNSKSLIFAKVGTKHIEAKNTYEHISTNRKAIYNTFTNAFETMYKRQKNNIDNVENDIIYNPNCGTTTSENINFAIEYLPFWQKGSRFNTYKNYLIFSHKFTIGIYDIKDEYNPKLILYTNVRHNFVFHGLVVLTPPTINVATQKNLNENWNDNCNVNIIKLLAFGGCGKKFVSSFVQYKVNLDELKMQSQKEQFGIVTNVTNDNLSNLSSIITETKKNKY